MVFCGGEWNCEIWSLLYRHETAQPLIWNILEKPCYKCSVFPTTKASIELKELLCIDTIMKNRGDFEEQMWFNVI